MSDRYEVTEDLQHYEQEDDTTPLVTEESLSSLAILGNTDYNGVSINDIDGIVIDSVYNRVNFNASKGFEITRKSDNKVMVTLDSLGNLFLAGDFESTDKSANSALIISSTIKDGVFKTSWLSNLASPFDKSYTIDMDSWNGISFKKYKEMSLTNLERQIVLSIDSLGMAQYLTTDDSDFGGSISWQPSKLRRVLGQPTTWTAMLMMSNVDMDMVNGIIDRVGKINIDNTARHINLRENAVDKWHIESVNGQFKIVETGVSARVLLNAGTSTTQMEIVGNDSMLKLNGSASTYMEYYIGATRQGWIGYASSTTFVMKNEQGDISITPKAVANRINLNGDVYVSNGVGVTLGSAGSANTANQLVVYNTGDSIILQSSNNSDAYNSGNIVWKTSGGFTVGRMHVYGTSYATTTMQFEVTDETGVLNPNPLLELNAAGANWGKMDGDFYPYQDNGRNLGSATLRWKQLFAGTTVISTSDERHKQQISVVPDSWLDAWSEVQFVRYKFNDSVAEKGNDARFHIGVIAQRIEEAFKKYGVDAFEAGILCYDEWVDEDGISHNLYSIRADECQFLEMALMRRELNKLKGIV